MYTGAIRGTAKFIIKNSTSNLGKGSNRLSNRSASGSKKLERFNRIFDEILNENESNSGWKTTQNKIEQNKWQYNKKRTF